MALEDILRKIRTDTEKKSKETKVAALASAKQIEDEGRKKAASLKKELLAEARENAAKEKERIIVNAQIQLKKEILSFKQQFVKDVFINAIDRIKKSDKAYQKLLEKTLAQFAQGDEEIILSSQDRRRFSDRWLKAFNKKHHLMLKYSKDAGKISGGVIIRSGKKEINASLKTLMKEIQEKYGAEIAKILFGEL